MATFTRRIAVPLAVIAGFLLFGTVFYRSVEGWSTFDSFYATAMTLTTVGYGDFTPTHPISKIVSIILAFAGIGLVFYSVGLISRHYYQREIEHRTHHVLQDAKRLLTKEERIIAHGLSRAFHAMAHEEQELEKIIRGKKGRKK